MTTPSSHFGVRLRHAMDTYGPVCAGIDPHPGLLDQWNLPLTADGLRTFSLRCVEAFAGVVACVKPQSAFFEAAGAAGIQVLEEVLHAAREAQLLTVLDVKRGDIGSTMGAYARAYLGDDSPLRADAITVSPYLGFESLRPVLTLAEQTHRGVFVLGLTSNPEGPEVQWATPHGDATGSVAGRILHQVAAENSRIEPDASGLGPVGLVVGATVGDAVRTLNLDLGATQAPLLVPGFGAQGGTRADVENVCSGALHHVLISSSRDILQAGPDPRHLREKARAVVVDVQRSMLHDQ